MSNRRHTTTPAAFPFRHFDPPFNASVLRRRDEQLDAIRLTDLATEFRAQADGAPNEEAA